TGAEADAHLADRGGPVAAGQRDPVRTRLDGRNAIAAVGADGHLAAEAGGGVLDDHRLPGVGLSKQRTGGLLRVLTGGDTRAERNGEGAAAKVAVPAFVLHGFPFVDSPDGPSTVTIGTCSRSTNIHRI